VERTKGKAEIAVASVDGPIALNHPDLVGASIRELPGSPKASCSIAESVACTHGTFVAGILSARRGSVAPAICPGCTLFLRPIFAETANGNGQMPARLEELAPPSSMASTLERASSTLVPRWFSLHGKAIAG
jgi:hypothetical protein